MQTRFLSALGPETEGKKIKLAKSKIRFDL